MAVRVKYLVTRFAAIALLFLFVFSLPVTYGHDLSYHIERLSCIAAEMGRGVFPVRLYSDYAYGWGMAAPLFYGDLPLYPSALLILAGVPLAAAYRFYIALCVTLLFCAMYYSSFTITGNRTASLLAAVIYAVSPYILQDIFLRSAAGELAAFIFMPLAFAGLYGIIHQSGKHRILLPIGMSGVIVCHMISAYLLALVLLLFTLMNVNRVIKNAKQIFAQLLVAIGLTLLLSAWFILPFLEQIISGTFYCTDGSTASRYGTLKDNAVATGMGIFTVDLFDIKHLVANGNNAFYPVIGPLFPLTLIVLLVFALSFRRSHPGYKINKLSIDYSIIIGIAILFALGFIPLGPLQSILGIIQFPFRVFAIVSVFSALLFGEAAAEFFTKVKSNGEMRVQAALAIVLAVLLSCSVVIQQPAVISKLTAFIGNDDVSEMLDKYFITSDTMGKMMRNSYQFDYLPSGSDLDHLIETRYILNSDDSTAAFPLFYYKGYAAEATDDEGNKVALTVSKGEGNRVSVKTEGYAIQSIHVYYRGTALQNISYMISSAAVICLCVFYIIRRQNNRFGSRAG